MTAMSMGVGYLIASTGPALVGAVRDLTGGWTWPIIVLLVLTVLQVPAAWRAVSAATTRP
jgi:CP family cyanate transporter-like MFS transporter